MKSKSKIKEDIRKHTEFRRDSDKLAERLFEVANNPTASAQHRTVVIVSTTYLENALRVAIEKHLLNPLDAGRIFEGDHAPLGDFSARIRMARGLGIIDESMEEDLNWLRAVRNSFAHSIDDVTFDSPGIEGALAHLSMRRREGFQAFVKSMGDKNVKVSHLSEYLFFIIEMMGKISTHHPQWKVHEATAAVLMGVLTGQPALLAASQGKQP
jgi:hypothetical protein